MEFTTIISAVTFFLALILGELAKKYNFIKKNKIPIQNICVGIFVACIEFIITKDFKLSIAVSGLTAGGVYDIFNNLNKMRSEHDE